MIEILNVTKRFDTLVALNQISLSIKEGSVVGLVGSNGAGKSTLLRILAGVYRADSGTVLFDGAEYKAHVYFDGKGNRSFKHCGKTYDFTIEH